MSVQLDQAQIVNSAMEKKAKQFDRIVVEWKQKVDGLSTDLDNSQKETRNASSELFKVKSPPTGGHTLTRLVSSLKGK